MREKNGNHYCYTVINTVLSIIIRVCILNCIMSYIIIKTFVIITFNKISTWLRDIEYLSFLHI